eukprot:2610704-Rhodomonas_salina.1
MFPLDLSRTARSTGELYASQVFAQTRLYAGWAGAISRLSHGRRSPGHTDNKVRSLNQPHGLCVHDSVIDPLVQTVVRVE